MFRRTSTALWSLILIMLLVASAYAPTEAAAQKLTSSTALTSPITLTVPSPASGTVAITATASVWGLKKLVISLDGSQIQSCTASSCTASWVTTQTTNGSHTVAAKALDRRNRVLASTSTTVQVDNDLTPPTVSLNAPSTATGSVTLSASASDAGGIATLTIAVDGVQLNAQEANVTFSSPLPTSTSTSVTWDTSTTTAGTHTVQAFATDGSGNAGSSPVASVIVQNGPSDPGVVSLDPYGGYTDLPVPGGATGYFRVGKLGNRWAFATPDGNAFWLRAVYNVNVSTHVDDMGSSYYNRVITKYGDADLTWGPQTNRRLLGWGFNALGEYANKWTLPWTTNGTWPSGQQSVKMPAIPYPLMVAWYGQLNTGNLAPGPVKELIRATDSHYTGYRGQFPDVFDPNFDFYVHGRLGLSEYVQAAASPYLLGISSDDTDNLTGFGPGPDFNTGYTHPHLGYIVLLTPPTQTSNPRTGITYSDTTVYTKLALRNFLQVKYGTIAALNAAWGSAYTTFDSNGGWPNGSGLLDENGKGAWVGTDHNELTNATAAVRTDLDEFLYQLAQWYFSIYRMRIKQHYPNALYLGPTTIGGWGAPPRRQILQAAGQYVDVIRTTVNETDRQAKINFIAQYAGDVPLMVWLGGVANPDSAFFRYPNGGQLETFQSQADRGTFYQSSLTALLTATAGPTSANSFIGLQWWEFHDNWGEKANWGLVTLSDNAYDGIEAAQAAGTDQWGYATGGEENNYGDFLGSVIEANASVHDVLAQ